MRIKIKNHLSELLSSKGSCVVKINTEKWAIFTNPNSIISIEKLSAIEQTFNSIEEKIKQGFYCVIFIPYEAALAFDSAFAVKKNTNLPLIWAAFFDKALASLRYEDFPNAENFSIDTKSEVTLNEYKNSLNKIQKYIMNGDTYQVNFTFRIEGKASLPAPKIFLSLFKTQKANFAAFINAGDFSIVSLSPELFIQKLSSKIISEPMKGTISRMPDTQRDLEQIKILSSDPKNRAENLMITDMVRNDIGKICRYGSVKTTKLFSIITTPFVHQMISRVEGRLKQNISLFDIFKALFPAASITGAPKVRTMQIIKEVEKSPRGIYTGTIGLVNKKSDFIFNVAIRTAIVKNKYLKAGIGGGIVADSNAKDEWSEAKLKASFLISKQNSFDIFETILYDKEQGGYIWLNEHLDRLEQSQKYFLRPFHREYILKHLINLSKKLPALARVKIILTEYGKIESEWQRLSHKTWGKNKVRIMISDKKVDSQNVFLYHKTTLRQIYDDELKKAQSSGYEEVIFMNENGHITEGAISNLFVKIDKHWLTPPLNCGLLPGICRKHLILQLCAKEQVIDYKQLMASKKVIICNSVRGFAEVEKIFF